MKTVAVRFTVTYEATIHIGDDECVDDAVSNINVPENDTCKYVSDSFSPTSVKEVKE